MCLMTLRQFNLSEDIDQEWTTLCSKVNYGLVKSQDTWVQQNLPRGYERPEDHCKYCQLDWPGEFLPAKGQRQ